MIRYALRCDKEHEFEAWFRSSADYDRAVAAGEAGCPICGPARVEKMPMAPVGCARAPEAGGEGQQAGGEIREGEPRRSARPQAAGFARGDARTPPPGDRARRLRRRPFRRGGAQDPLQGERGARHLRRGDAEEAKKLVDEGIEFQPLPTFRKSETDGPGQSSPAPTAASALRSPAYKAKRGDEVARRLPRSPPRSSTRSASR